MASGSFQDIFGFPIGKKISETIFLVDFLRQSKWKNPIFRKKKKSSLGFQKEILISLFFLKNLVWPFWLPWKINQKNNIAYFITYWEPKNFAKCSPCHFMPLALLSLKIFLLTFNLNHRSKMESKVSFFVQCTKMQLITLTFNIVLANFFGFSA